MSAPAARKMIAENRKARHDFHIVERVEAGIALTGTEVKSLRDGGGNIRESYAQLRNGEVFLVGANIAPYRQGNLQNHEPVRDRKLLLHRREIHQLGVKVAQRGMTCGQRVWKRQPAGGASGLGTSPASTISWRGVSKSIGSAAAKRAWV